MYKTVEHSTFVSLCRYPGMKLLGHIVNLYLIFKKWPNSVSQYLDPFKFLSFVFYEEFTFFTSSSILVTVMVAVILVCVKCYLHCYLICIALVVDGTTECFFHVLIVHKSSLVNIARIFLLFLMP